MIKEHRIELFACRASKGFAEKVVESWNAHILPGEERLHLGQLEVTPFSDGEFQPQFTESVRGATVFVLQSTFPRQRTLWNCFSRLMPQRGLRHQR